MSRKKTKTYTFREACNAVIDDEPFEGVVEVTEYDLHEILAEGVWEESKFWANISVEEMDAPVRIHFKKDIKRMRGNGYNE